VGPRCGGEKIHYPFRELIPGRPAYSLVTVVTELLWIATVYFYTHHTHLQRFIKPKY